MAAYFRIWVYKDVKIIHSAFGATNFCVIYQTFGFLFFNIFFLNCDVFHEKLSNEKISKSLINGWGVGMNGGRGLDFSKMSSAYPKFRGVFGVKESLFYTFLMMSMNYFNVY